MCEYLHTFTHLQDVFSLLFEASTIFLSQHELCNIFMVNQKLQGSSDKEQTVAAVNVGYNNSVVKEISKKGNDHIFTLCRYYILLQVFAE